MKEEVQKEVCSFYEYFENEDILVNREQDATRLGCDYVNFVNKSADASVQNFIDDIYKKLDYYCNLSRAIRILDILNKYSVMDDKFFESLELRYGKTSSILRTFRRFKVQDKFKAGQDIWTLKKTYDDAFIEILKLASREHQELIPRPIIAHLALLRFYVVSLLDKLAEIDEFPSLCITRMRD